MKEKKLVLVPLDTRLDKLLARFLQQCPPREPTHVHIHKYNVPCRMACQVGGPLRFRAVPLQYIDQGWTSMCAIKHSLVPYNRAQPVRSHLEHSPRRVINSCNQ